MTQEGPESYAHGAHVAPEQYRAGADIIPFQKFMDAVVFMSWLKRAPSRMGMGPMWPLNSNERAPMYFLFKIVRAE